MTTQEIQSIFEDYLTDDLTRQAHSVNGMMAPSFVSADPDTMTATLQFTVLPWESNRTGGLHGGIIGAMLDHTCGLIVSCFLGHWAPTMNLNVEYIRPVAPGDSLLATAHIISMGRHIIRVNGALCQQASGKLVASCTATFFNKED
ncbi:MAG: PaaI family thioesterase [Firmicutes bacterium]|nr:PaaI family thioesterase [Bacillota bacterium]